MSGRIEVVAFDFDGVLNRSGAFSAWLEGELGVSEGDRAAFFQGPFREPTVGAGGLRESLAPFAARWTSTGVDALIARWFELDDNLDPEMLAAVATVRAAGLRTALATNQELLRANYIRDHERLTGLFDNWCFSCEMGAAKPDAAYFAAVEGRIGVPPESILFFDDVAANVGAARARGWAAELFEGFAGFRAALRRHLPAVRLGASG